jgi:hypothetical protein
LVSLDHNTEVGSGGGNSARRTWQPRLSSASVRNVPSCIPQSNFIGGGYDQDNHISLILELVIPYPISTVMMEATTITSP